MPKKSPLSVEAQAARVEKANRRKRKALEEAEALQEAEAELEAEVAVEDVEPGIPGASKAAEILAELKGEGSYDVYFIKDGQQLKLGTYDIPTWPEAMESLVKRKGGGDYLVVFRDEDGKQAGRITRTYDPDIYGGPRASSSPAAAPSMDMTGLLALMQKMAEDYNKRADEMRAELARQQGETTKMMLEMVRANNTGFLKNAQELSVLKQLFSGQQKNPIEEMLALRDLMDEFRDGAKREDSGPVMGFIERFAESIGRSILKSQGQAPETAEPSNQIPHDAPRRAHTPPEKPAPKLDNPAPKEAPMKPPFADNIFVVTYGPMLLGAAKLNEDPNEWASKIIDTVPAVYHGKLVEFVNRGDLVDVLAQYNPEVKNYSEWFESVAESILDEFKADAQEPEPIAINGSGNASSESH